MRTHLELAQLFNTISNWDTIGTDTQYKILDFPDEVVIIFCPSNSKADWRINFSFPKKPYKRMATPFYVHGGFLKEWKGIHDHFLKFARTCNKPITITGWSYGGAMATLCYEDIWFNQVFKRCKMKLITFGSPRVIGAYNFKGISNCPLCAIGDNSNKTRIWSLAEMDADHVAAWSKGGATDISNCQMLCKSHNRAKGNR
jgi:hypothetical protein